MTRPTKSSITTDNVGSAWALEHTDMPSVRPGSPSYDNIRGEMEHLKTEFFRIQDEMKAKMSEKSIAFSRLAWQVAPVRRLPPEVLGMIFIELVGEMGISFRDNRKLNILLATCSKWRAVAITTPASWQGINLSNMKKWFPPLPKNATYLARLKTWIQRSGSLPLQVRLVEFGSPDKDGQFFFLLASEYKRWESLTIIRDSAYQELTASFGMDFSGERSLENIVQTPFKASLGEPLYDFKALKALEASELTGCLTMPRMQAKNLTSIKFHELSTTYAGYMDIVEGTPNIRLVDLTSVVFLDQDPKERRAVINTDRERRLGHKYLETIVMIDCLVDSDSEDQTSIYSIACRLMQESICLRSVKMGSTVIQDSPQGCLFHLAPSFPNYPLQSSANVTTLYLDPGELENLNYLEQLTERVVPFLRQFVNLQHFTFQFSDIALEGVVPEDLLLITCFSQALFGVVMDSVKLRSLRLDSLAFPQSHLIYVAKKIASRSSDLRSDHVDFRCAIGNDCSILKDRFTDSDFDSSLFDNTPWSEFGGNIFDPDIDPDANPHAFAALEDDEYWSIVPKTPMESLRLQVQQLAPGFNLTEGYW